MVPQELPGGRVALRKESVDRNIAWIAETLKHNVALRKESVDRNIRNRLDYKALSSRSPQGERG